jgi:hypothetical protein
MDMEKFEGAEKALSYEEIVEIAAGWGLTLPREFIEFYVKNNGGYPPFDAIEGEEYVYAIDYFIPIGTIDRLIRDNVGQGVDIQGKIPFAADPADNVFVLSLAPEDYGSVYLFGHENDPGEGSSSAFICGSFTDFITGLTNEYQDE